MMMEPAGVIRLVFIHLSIYEEGKGKKTKKKQSKLKAKDKRIRKKHIQCPYDDQHKFNRLAPGDGPLFACFPSFSSLLFVSIQKNIIIFMLYSEWNRTKIS